MGILPGAQFWGVSGVESFISLRALWLYLDERWNGMEHSIVRFPGS